MGNEEPDSYEFTDLVNEDELRVKLINFHKQNKKIQNLLEPLCNGEIYSKLSDENKVKHDLFISYALTSLSWIHFKALGQNPVSHGIKAEVDRVQEHSKRLKLLKERKTIPHLNVDAAKRFIKGGLWVPEDVKGKKRKRNSSGEDG